MYSNIFPPWGQATKFISFFIVFLLFLHTVISLTGQGSGYKGPMYIDDLILSAKKVTKIHYDKKDYKKIYGFRTYSGKKITVKTAPVK